MNVKHPAALVFLFLLGIGACLLFIHRQRPLELDYAVGSGIFSQHIPVASDSIYPRLDFKSVPKFPCEHRNDPITSCFVDELLGQAPALIGRTSYLDILSQSAFKYANPSSLKIIVDELKKGTDLQKTSAVFAQAASGDIEGSIGTLKNMAAEKHTYPLGQTPPLMVTGRLMYYAKDMDKAMAFMTASQSIKFRVFVPKGEKIKKDDKGQIYHVMKVLINERRGKDAERFAEGIANNNVYSPGKSGNDILAELRKEMLALRKKNMHLLKKLPLEISGATIDLFSKSVSEVFNLVIKCRDSGLLNEAREILKDVRIVTPNHLSREYSVSGGLYGLFKLLDLPDRAGKFAQQFYDEGVVIPDDVFFDGIVKTAEVDNGKNIFDFINRHKTEAERGYQSAIILRSFLRLDNPDFDLVAKLWPPAIGWCMQRNPFADMGPHTALGFYHDEDRPNTYPACIIQLLPNHSFSYSLRGH